MVVDTAPPSEMNTDANNTNTASPAVSPEPEYLTCHGVIWRHENTGTCLNGSVEEEEWRMKVGLHRVIHFGSDVQEEALMGYFEASFPMKFLSSIVYMTNALSLSRNGHVASAGEYYDFFGALLLMTRVEFGKRSDLWSKTSISKYLPLPQFGRFVRRNKFEELFAAITFSAQPQDAAGMTSAEHRWCLINDFVTAFNTHRRNHFFPSELLCVDESMVRWYGLGGTWMDIGLPHYVSIDRKPGSGCEIQNLACGRSGVMMRLELVTAAEDEHGRKFEGMVNHGTAVLKRLVLPWQCTNRIVCADSYFASVESAEELLKLGLKFIGVVKTATRCFPMKYLGGLVMPKRGYFVSLTADSCCLRIHNKGETNGIIIQWQRVNTTTGAENRLKDAREFLVPLWSFTVSYNICASTSICSHSIS